MKRLLAVATLAGLVLPIPLVAQRRGGFARPVASGSFHMGSSFAPTRAVSPMRPAAARSFRPAMRPAPSSGWRGGFPRGPRPFSRPHHFFGRNPFLFGQPGFSTVFWSAPPFWYGPPDSGPSDEPPPAAAPDQAEQDSGLADQVAQLTDEVQALRDEQSAGQPVAQAPAPPEKRVAAVLVYRDGHQAEVSDYALVGQTLWVFSGPRTRRVSLADVNLEATNRLNDSRGIDFTLPTSR